MGTTASTFAAKLGQRGARDVTTTDGFEGGVTVRQVRATGPSGVTVTSLFATETYGFLGTPEHFMWAKMAGRRQPVTTMKAVLEMLGLQPDKPYKVGYAGGTLREAATFADALQAVRRLWVGDDQPMEIRQWKPGTGYTPLRTFTARPTFEAVDHALTVTYQL